MVVTEILDINRTVASVTSEVTDRQAAKFLGIPEAQLNELLNCGVIEFRQNGENRMVLQTSLLRYDRRKKQGFTAMAEIVRLSQEAGLYDE